MNYRLRKPPAEQARNAQWEQQKYQIWVLTKYDDAGSYVLFVQRKLRKSLLSPAQFISEYERFYPHHLN